MEVSEAKKLAETIEAGLRDGRTLESLRKAMKDSGYSEDDLRQILANVDRKRIIRKPKKKESRKINVGMTTIAVLAVAIILGAIVLISRPPAESPEPSNGVQGIIGNKTVKDVYICYVINETIKQKMIDAGVECDKWYLIKEI